MGLSFFFFYLYHTMLSGFMLADSNDYLSMFLIDS